MAAPPPRLVPPLAIAQTDAPRTQSATWGAPPPPLRSVGVVRSQQQRALIQCHLRQPPASISFPSAASETAEAAPTRGEVDGRVDGMMNAPLMAPPPGRKTSLALRRLQTGAPRSAAVSLMPVPSSALCGDGNGRYGGVKNTAMTSAAASVATVDAVTAAAAAIASSSFSSCRSGTTSAGMKRNASDAEIGAEGMAPPALRLRVGLTGSGAEEGSHVPQRQERQPMFKAEPRLRSGDTNAVGTNIVAVNDSVDEEVRAAEAEASPPATHVVFCVDASGSMKKADVRNGETMISRWDAIFICLDELLDEQLQSSRQSGEGMTVGDVEFSLVWFSDRAQVLFKRVSIGDGEDVRRRLRKVQKKHPPSGGTVFSAAFDGVKRVASESKGSVMVVFVSDGRPGDLTVCPPSGNEIQRTFKSHKKTHPSVAVHMEDIVRQHGSRLSLQFLCLFKDGEAWLKKLATIFKGSFHMPQLRLGRAAVSRGSAPKRFDSSAMKEDEVHVVRTKSVEERLRESYEQAERAGNVVEVRDTTCMRSTFQAFSTTLTTMRTSVIQSGNRPVRERQVVLESNAGSLSEKKRFQATLMTLHPTQDKFVVPTSEKSNSRLVELSIHPFAQGGLRNVYRMTELNYILQATSRQELVAKESRHEMHYKERLRFHVETLRCQARALEWAKMFNAKVRAFNEKTPAERRGTHIPRVTFLKADVYRLKDDTSPGGFRYLAVERRLDGKYEKFNDNNGGILSADASLEAEKNKRRRIKVAQAFSHFTYQESGGMEMVVDIQGVGHAYTDPQLHSAEKKYGRADLGERGIVNFFESHQCNVCCKALGLKREKTQV